MLDSLSGLGFPLRLAACAVIAAAAGCGMFANTVRRREVGLFAFLFNSDNFNELGKVSRIVFFVSAIAVVSVFTMHAIALVSGGPIVDLDKLK